MVSPIDSFRVKIEPGRTGYVYLIHAQGTSRYKIGRSINPPERTKDLQKQSPYLLKIVDQFYSPDAITDEFKLHQKFSKVRVHGEWFEFLDEQTACHVLKSWTYQQIRDNALLALKDMGVDLTDPIRDVIEMFLFENWVNDIDALWKAIERIQTFTAEIAMVDRSFATGFALGYFFSATACLNS